MSAKEAYKKPEVHLAILPPELWQYILRLATAVPDPLFPTLQSIWVSTHDARKRWKASLVTKRYVIRVCKKWYALAIPFLYEHLDISRTHKSIRPILDAVIVSSPTPLADTAVSKGVYTKRVDINFNLAPDTAGEVVEDVRRLLHRLPNLRVLCIWTHGDILEAFTGAGQFILDGVSPSLEHISWDVIESFNFGPDEQIAATRWATFLQQHPNLRTVVDTGLVEHHLNDTTHRFSGLSLPRLTTLAINGPQQLQHRRAWSLNFPALTTIAFRDTLSNYQAEEITKAFPWKNTLTKLEFRCSQFYGPVQNVHAMVQRFTQVCPHLHELYISSTWESPIREEASEPCRQITTLGVHCELFQFPKRFAKRLFREWAEAKVWFPNLRVLRFTEERNVLHLERQHPIPLRDGVAHLRSLGLEVQSFDGTPLALADTSG